MWNYFLHSAGRVNPCDSAEHLVTDPEPPRGATESAQVAVFPRSLAVTAEAECGDAWLWCDHKAWVTSLLYERARATERDDSDNIGQQLGAEV
jgi:hypothetical protein